MTLEEIKKNNKLNQLETDGFHLSEGITLEVQDQKINLFKSCGSYGSVYTDIDYKYETISDEDYKTIYDSVTVNSEPAANVIASMRRKRPFEYYMLSRMDIYTNDSIETALTSFDTITKKIVIEYNERFIQTFAEIMSITYSLALMYILEHELEHIVRNHIRITPGGEPRHTVYNLVFDMAINAELRRVYFSPKMGVNELITFQGKLKKPMTFNDMVRKAQTLGVMKIKDRRSANRKRQSGEVTVGYYNEQLAGNEEELAKSLSLFIEDIFESKVKTQYLPITVEGIVPTMGSIQALNQIVDEAVERADEDIRNGDTDLSKDNSCKRYSLCAKQATNIMRAPHTSKPFVKWRTVLRSYLMKGLSSVEEYEVSRPNARIEGQFGRDIDKPQIKRVLFAIDVSGSMTVSDYSEALSEIAGILGALNIARVDISVVWWGASIVEEHFRSYVEFKERCTKATPSLGGTNADMMLNALQKYKREDLYVIFTDGVFHEPRVEHNKTYIWCITSSGTTEYIPKDRNKVVKVENK